MLAAELVKRPVAPSALADASLLASIHERSNEALESGALGAWVATGSVPPLTDGEGAQWSEAVLADPQRVGLVDELLQPPKAPEPEVWGRMRRSILAEFGAGRDRTRRLRPRSAVAFALVSVAASVVLSIFLFAPRPPATPSITFTDIDRAPDIDFAVVRYGLRR